MQQTKRMSAAQRKKAYKAFQALCAGKFNTALLHLEEIEEVRGEPTIPQNVYSHILSARYACNRAARALGDFLTREDARNAAIKKRSVADEPLE